MTRPTVEVADIIQAQGDRFVDFHRQELSYQQLNVLRAIRRCRTAELGGHVDDCPRCGHTAISYNSCRNRHCPKCQAQARQRWLAAREQELLGVSYFHVVFTLPHELIPLCQRNPKVLYDLLFQTSAATLLEIAADPKHLGAKIGFLSILHTWGQNLLAHPHVHCVIPAGGFSADQTRWVHPKYPFFLPVKVLSRVFRGKFVDALKRTHRKKKIQFSRTDAALEQPKQFPRFLRTLFRQDWVVYAKPAFGGASQVLRYLGRYTHRVAISNHRLLAFDGERVTFRWKDYAHGNKQRKMTLTATEFLRRFVQHVLPRRHIQATRARRRIPFRGSDVAVPALRRADAHWPDSQRPATGLSMRLPRQLMSLPLSDSMTRSGASLPSCVCSPENTPRATISPSAKSCEPNSCQLRGSYLPPLRRTLDLWARLDSSQPR